MVDEKGTREMIIKDLREAKFQGKIFSSTVRLSSKVNDLPRNLQYAT